MEKLEEINQHSVSEELEKIKTSYLELLGENARLKIENKLLRERTTITEAEKNLLQLAKYIVHELEPKGKEF